MNTTCQSDYSIRSYEEELYFSYNVEKQPPIREEPSFYEESFSDEGSSLYEESFVNLESSLRGVSIVDVERSVMCNDSGTTRGSCYVENSEISQKLNYIPSGTIRRPCCIVDFGAIQELDFPSGDFRRSCYVEDSEVTQESNYVSSECTQESCYDMPSGALQELCYTVDSELNQGPRCLADSGVTKGPHMPSGALQGCFYTEPPAVVKKFSHPADSGVTQKSFFTSKVTQKSQIPSGTPRGSLCELSEVGIFTDFSNSGDSPLASKNGLINDLPTSGTFHNRSCPEDQGDHPGDPFSKKTGFQNIVCRQKVRPYVGTGVNFEFAGGLVDRFEFLNNQKGKKYEEIVAFTMTRSKNYVPDVRSPSEVYKQDDEMEPYYRNATFLDDEIDDEENIISRWEEMIENKTLLEMIAKVHYVKPRVIQSAVIPRILKKENIVCQAENAAGKTMAFVLPIIEQVLKALDDRSYSTRCNPTPFAMVIVPTRELAIQIREQFSKLLVPFRLHVGCCIGEYDINMNQNDCRNIEIVVGCPGRLSHFVRDSFISLKSLKFLVLDEADKLFDDQGFVNDIQTIYNAIPGTYQTLFFTATLSEKMMHAVRSWTMNRYSVVKTKTKKLVTKGIFKFVFVKKDAFKRQGFVKDYIEKNCKIEGRPLKALVFCDTKEIACKMAIFLRNHDFRTEILSSDMNQQSRDRVVRCLRDGSQTIIVFSTNVAARGLDIPELDHVIVLKFKMESDFIHRIGRTGRLKNGFIHVFFDETVDSKDIDEFIENLRSIDHEIPQELIDLKFRRAKWIDFVPQDDS